MGDHLRPEVPDPRRRGNRREGLAERSPRVADQPLGEGHHRPVGDLDASEAAPVGQLDAAAEGVVRAEHAAAHVFGVAEAAERRRFLLNRAGFAGQFEAPAVRPQAALDVAAREAQVAAEEVDAGRLRGELPAAGGGRRLGALEIRECAVQVVGDPLHRREPDQRPATLAVVRCRGQRGFKGGQGGRHLAEVVQDVGPERAEDEAVGPVAGEFEAAFRRAQRAFVAVVGALRLCRGEIGAGRARVVGPVEVLGAERRVASFAPLRGAAVQFAPPAPQHAVVDRVADQRMGEQERPLALRADQGEFGDPLDVAIGLAKEVAQRFQVEALAEHGGGLERDPVVRVEPVEPRLDEALHRARHGGSAALLLGVAEELLQEQRVAGRSLDAAFGQGGVRGEESPCQSARFRGVERAEVEGQRLVPGCLGPPCRTQRVAFDARRGYQDRRAPGNGGAERGQVRQGSPVGPMEVLDHEQARAGAARPLGQAEQNAPAALGAGRIVHGVVERAQLGRLLHPEQVVQEHRVLGRVGGVVARSRRQLGRDRLACGARRRLAPEHAEGLSVPEFCAAT